jgi:hypothetical protein
MRTVAPITTLVVGVALRSHSYSARCWHSVYQAKPADAISWYGPHLHESLRYVHQAAARKDAAIIESTLVDDLWLRDTAISQRSTSPRWRSRSRSESTRTPPRNRRFRTDAAPTYPPLISWISAHRSTAPRRQAFA